MLRIIQRELPYGVSQRALVDQAALCLALVTTDKIRLDLKDMHAKVKSRPPTCITCACCPASIRAIWRAKLATTNLSDWLASMIEGPQPDGIQAEEGDLPDLEFIGSCRGDIKIIGAKQRRLVKRRGRLEAQPIDVGKGSKHQAEWPARHNAASARSNHTHEVRLPLSKGSTNDAATKAFTARWINLSG